MRLTANAVEHVLRVSCRVPLVSLERRDAGHGLHLTAHMPDGRRIVHEVSYRVMAANEPSRWLQHELHSYWTCARRDWLESVDWTSLHRLPVFPATVPHRSLLSYRYQEVLALLDAGQKRDARMLLVDMLCELDDELGVRAMVES